MSIEEKFYVTDDSALLERNTSFRYIPRDEIRKAFRLDSFVREEDKKEVELFIKLCKPSDSFYFWDNSGPLCGGGGICIFRRNRPLYAYGLWIS